MKQRQKNLILGIAEISIVAGSMIAGAIGVKKYVEEHIKVVNLEKETELLRKDISTITDFIEWDLNYMEDKANLNMIELESSELYRFGEKELAEVKGKTKVYIKNELLGSVRGRIKELRESVR